MTGLGIPPLLGSPPFFFGFLWFPVYGSRLYGSRFTAPCLRLPDSSIPFLGIPPIRTRFLLFVAARLPNSRIPPFHIVGTILSERLCGSFSGPVKGDAVVADVLRPS